MKIAFTGLMIVATVAFGLTQLVAGWLGINHLFGSWWAFAALVALWLFRTMLPFTIGAFFCAKDVWQWHWSLALLFALPGLAFAVPAALGSILMVFRERTSKQRDPEPSVSEQLRSIIPTTSPDRPE